MVGIIATTPVSLNLLEIVLEVKKIEREILVIVGSVHVTTYPDNALSSENIDIVAISEADFLSKTLSNQKIRLNLKDAYHGFYFRPVQFYKQFLYSVRDKPLLDKFFYLFKTRWFWL